MQITQKDVANSLGLAQRKIETIGGKMNDLVKTTITTLEVAEMMEVEHSKLTRKFERSKDRKGYIEILGEAHLGVTDYFIKSSYKTAQNKEMPCYEVTKLGCDFLANKSTGKRE